ncbi:MAG TPA: S8 family serine peptidase [Gemmatimonadaceae bacterium]|nr:S8 family serine peptidase [Gemmatimonadaceae bacterium]
MSRFVYAGITAIAVASLAACSDAPVSPNKLDAPDDVVLSANVGGGPEQVMAGEVIVKLKDMSGVEAVAREHGLAVGERGYRDAFVVMRGNAGVEQANARALKGDSRVEYAEPNYLRQPTTINTNLWAFYNPGNKNMLYTKGQNSGKPISSSYASLADADEDNIEGYAAGGSIVTIGSIDTGVDFTHSEFAAGQLIAGRDWYSNDNDPSDTDGHGTHTTGTMVGRTVGLAGVSGAGSNVRVYVQRVCGQRGCPTSAIINAINAAATYIDPQGHHLVAVNMSLGGTSESSGEAQAIATATANGVLIIASAGNDGSGTVACPACDVNAISVMSTNWRDAKASYSQYGSGLDIAAPGGECYSNTTPDGCIYSSYKGGGYAWLQGTSMAAPQVTGTAGIVASKAGVRGSDLRTRLISSGDTGGSYGTYGVRRLNSYRAVTGNSLSGGL